MLRIIVLTLFLINSFACNNAFAEGYDDGSVDPYTQKQVEDALKTLNQYQSRANETPKLNSQEGACEFISTMTNDDYRGNISKRTSSYNNCLEKDGKKIFIDGSQIKFWEFLGFPQPPNDIETSFARRCTAGSLEQQGHLQGKFLYFTKRLQLHEKDLLEQYVMSQHILGKKPLEGFDCRTRLMFDENYENCQNLKNTCDASQSEMPTWVEKTKEVELEIDKLTKNILPARKRYHEIKNQHCFQKRDMAASTVCYEPSGPLGVEYQNLKSEIAIEDAKILDLQQEVPWIYGNKYKEMTSGNKLDSKKIEQGIRAQLKENQPLLQKAINDNRLKYECLRGETAYGDCSMSEFYTHIQQTPEVEPGIEVREDENRAIEIHQCLYANQVSDEKSKAFALGAANFASYFVGSALLAPRLVRGAYTFISGTRTLVNAVGVASATAGISIFGVSAYRHVKEACSEEQAALKKATENAISDKSCVLSSESFKNLERRQKHCLRTIALESVVLGFVGAQVAKGLGGFRYSIDLMKTAERARGTPVETLLNIEGKRVRAYATQIDESTKVVQWIERPVPIVELEQVAIVDRVAVIERLKAQGVNESDLLIETVAGKLRFSKWTQTNVVSADSLTGFIDARGIEGKTLVDDVLRSAVKSAESSATKGEYVVYIELDAESLSAANAWAYALGNDYITAIGKVMQNNLRVNVLTSKTVGRASDIGIRTGGDELAAIATIKASNPTQADAIISEMVKKLERAAAASPEIQSLVVRGQERLTKFREGLAQTQSFGSLNEQTKLIVEHSKMFKALPAETRDAVRSSEESYRKFIADFAKNSEELNRIQSRIADLRFGISGGGVRVTAGATPEEIKAAADTLAQGSKQSKAINPDVYPRGKPTKENVGGFPESPTAVAKEKRDKTPPPEAGD